MATDKSMGLRGKVVVLTGASEGIGKELALQLAGRGAELVLAARSAEALSMLCQQCKDQGVRALAVPTDVSVPSQCQRLIAHAIEAFGGVDVLINNAGISMQTPFDQVHDLTLLERLMQVNYLGAAYCTYHALPHLKQRRGIVVGVSSLQGKFGFPRSTGYAASKHAMQGFFDSLRIELRGSGVAVLVVSPGPVATDIHTHRLGPDGRLQVQDSPQRGARSMSVKECASQITRALECRQRELVMTWQGKAATWLRLLAPGLLDHMVDRAVRRFYQD